MFTHLRELTITYNSLKTMDGLNKLVNLRSLTLDRNRIKAITGIKHLRKLEKLSLVGNLIKEVSPTDSSEPMIDLKEIDLSKNLIKCIEQIHSYPNI
jgi:Leucine-rich repeat (LRR) protein